MRNGIAGLIFFALLTPFAVSANQAAVVEGQDLLTGRPVKVSAENNSGLVVIFMSNHCPCSASHVGEAKALAQEYKAFRFVAIHSNADETETDAKSYFSQVDLGFPVIQDHASQLAARFKALKTPHAFLLLPDGTLAYQGGVSSSKDFQQAEHKYLRDALDDLTHKRAVRVAQARTLGCAIARAR